MHALAPIAAAAAALLVQSRQTVAVSESSAGGLISAALLVIPGASAYFLGGGVIYTQGARRTLLAIPDEGVKGIRSSTEAMALLAARTIRERFGPFDLLLAPWQPLLESELLTNGATSFPFDRYFKMLANVQLANPRAAVPGAETCELPQQPLGHDRGHGLILNHRTGN